MKSFTEMDARHVKKQLLDSTDAASKALSHSPVLIVRNTIAKEIAPR